MIIRSEKWSQILQREIKSQQVDSNRKNAPILLTLNKNSQRKNAAEYATY